MIINTAPVRGKHVLVALSGGADSVALLLILLDEGITVSAAHFEHGLRAGQSEADMEFARALCARLKVPFFFARADVEKSRAPGEGVETAARRLRYAFLLRARKQSGADFLATAHHKDDQAETVLMHILRGAGSAGAKAMREVEGVLYRPFLRVRKAEILRYLRARGQDFCEDATNAVPDNPRNALRMEILPRLEKIYPGCVDALCRFAEIEAMESAALDHAAAVWGAQSFARGPWGGYFSMEDPPQEAVFRRAIKNALGEAADFATLRRISALAQSKRGKLCVSGEIAAERAGGGLYLLKNSTPPSAVSLQTAGKTRFGDVCTLSARPCAPIPVRGDPFRQALLFSALFGAVVRTRRAGDFLYPLGAGGKKLLSDYFTDKKIDRPLRDWIPLIAKGAEILWVIGMGISENCAVRPGDLSIEIRCDFPENHLKQYFGGTKA